MAESGHARGLTHPMDRPVGRGHIRLDISEDDRLPTAPPTGFFSRIQKIVGDLYIGSWFIWEWCKESCRQAGYCCCCYGSCSVCMVLVSLALECMAAAFEQNADKRFGWLIGATVVSAVTALTLVGDILRRHYLRGLAWSLFGFSDYAGVATAIAHFTLSTVDCTSYGPGHESILHFSIFPLLFAFCTAWSVALELLCLFI